jgi:hypothetical protein
VVAKCRPATPNDRAAARAGAAEGLLPSVRQ